MHAGTVDLPCIVMELFGMMTANISEFATYMCKFFGNMADDDYIHIDEHTIFFLDSFWCLYFRKYLNTTLLSNSVTTSRGQFPWRITTNKEQQEFYDKHHGDVAYRAEHLKYPTASGGKYAEKEGLHRIQIDSE